MEVHGVAKHLVIRINEPGSVVLSDWFRPRKTVFTLQEGENAFITLLPGCSAIHKDAVLYNHLCNTLIELIAVIPVGVLQCKPEQEAALKCEAAFKATLA